jgi:hypothetical protein
MSKKFKSFFVALLMVVACVGAQACRSSDDDDNKDAGPATTAPDGATTEKDTGTNVVITPDASASTDGAAQPQPDADTANGDQAANTKAPAQK